MQYFIIWVEGLHWKTGEKIHLLDHEDHTYTHYMTKALRVKDCDREAAHKRLRDQGVVSDFITFIPTSYAPAGTIWNPNN